ncbi:MAG: hypothetical protein US58_C0012G0001, partial [Candidatus Magasanikbacteria bacterium GW2011_GWA2_37_8]
IDGQFYTILTNGKTGKVAMMASTVNSTEIGQCQDGFERRTCEDVNRCGTEDNRPFESQPCSAAETSQSQGQESGAPAQQTQPNFLTAFVTANPSAAGAIIVAIFGAGFVGWETIHPYPARSWAGTVCVPLHGTWYRGMVSPSCRGRPFGRSQVQVRGIPVAGAPTARWLRTRGVGSGFRSQPGSVPQPLGLRSFLFLYLLFLDPLRGIHTSHLVGERRNSGT